MIVGSLQRPHFLVRILDLEDLSAYGPLRVPMDLALTSVCRLVTLSKGWVKARSIRLEKVARCESRSRSTAGLSLFAINSRDQGM